MTNKSQFSMSEFFDLQWHDCRIYGMSFGDDYEFVLDIDYISEWQEPSETTNNKYYSFMVAPSTLVFRRVTNLNIQLEIVEPFNLVIDELKMNEISSKRIESIQKTQFAWVISTFQGYIEFVAEGFDMYYRSNPRKSTSQNFELDERGGISFYRGLVE